MIFKTYYGLIGSPFTIVLCFYELSKDVFIFDYKFLQYYLTYLRLKKPSIKEWIF